MKEGERERGKERGRERGKEGEYNQRKERWTEEDSVQPRYVQFQYWHVGPFRRQRARDLTCYKNLAVHRYKRHQLHQKIESERGRVSEQEKEEEMHRGKKGWEARNNSKSNHQIF